MASGWAAAFVVGLGVLVFQASSKNSERAEFAERRADSRPERPISLPQPGQHAVAFVEQLLRVDSDALLAEGQSLAAGQELVLAEGIMELVFFSGAQLTIRLNRPFK